MKTMFDTKYLKEFLLYLSDYKTIDNELLKNYYRIEIASIYNSLNSDFKLIKMLHKFIETVKIISLDSELIEKYIRPTINEEVIKETFTNEYFRIGMQYTNETIKQELIDLGHVIDKPILDYLITNYNHLDIIEIANSIYDNPHMIPKFYMLINPVLTKYF